MYKSMGAFLIESATWLQGKPVLLHFPPGLGLIDELRVVPCVGPGTALEHILAKSSGALLLYM